MKKVGMLLGGCVVMFLLLFIAALIIGMVVGLHHQAAAYSGPLQVVALILIGAYLFFVIHVLRT